MIIKKISKPGCNLKKVEFGTEEKKIDNPFIVPNVSAIAREMTSSSQIGMIIKRFIAISLSNKVKLGLNNLSFITSLLKKDFATGVKVLCELEILKINEKEKVEHFVLHNQMVDMAVAFNNKKLLRAFVFLANKYNFIPGIITYNIESTIRYLSSIPSLSKSLVIYTPLSQVKSKSVLEYLVNSSLKVVDVEN